MTNLKEIRQKWYPYTLWEDYLHGMYRKLDREEQESLLRLAIDFTGDDELYGSWMLRVAKEWPISCENNFTDMSINHRAWIGHAACCMAINCPEQITRQAWWELTDEQRDKANARADYAIALWNNRYLYSYQMELTYDSI
jgi:hypothetical protein